MTTATQHSDIVILGSGFSGSLLAIICIRLGYSVTLLERGTHPRFAIGESSTPLANLLWEQLCDEYDLPQLRHFSTYGTWVHNYPYVACGKKRGFSFLFHNNETVPETYLVTASPNDSLSDTHWYRSEFDEFLAIQAAKLGVCYLDKTTVDAITETEKGMSLATVREGQAVTLTCRFLVDAGGASSNLNSLLNIPRRKLSLLPDTGSLFSHFRKVTRPFPAADEAPPFPPYDAAVHHLFEGGWMWNLSFDNGITSAGFTVRPELKEKLNCANPDLLWQQLMEKVPYLKPAFANAVPAQPLFWVNDIGYRSAFVVGTNWAMLPSAAGFVDPLLSSGFSLTLLGIQRLATILRNLHRGASVTELQAYEKQTRAELDATELLVAALYRHFTNPPLFRELTKLYFAAVSFAENAHRLGKSELARQFLLLDNIDYNIALTSCCREALELKPGASQASLISNIRQAVEPFDLIGLNHSWKNNWVPVDFSIFIANAHKLGISPGAARDYLVANHLMRSTEMPLETPFLSGQPL